MVTIEVGGDGGDDGGDDRDIGFGTWVGRSRVGVDDVKRATGGFGYGVVPEDEWGARGKNRVGCGLLWML